MYVSAPHGLARWLRESRDRVEEIKGAPAEGAVVVSLRDDSGEIASLTVHPDDTLREGAGPALSPTERDIVRAVRVAHGNRRTTAKAIAKEIGRPCDNALYTLLKNLTEREPPVLDSDQAGYVVVGVLAGRSQRSQ